jgi:hypothetical protein
MTTAITEQSAENRQYVRILLRCREPEFSAALELALELVAREERLKPPASPRRYSCSELIRKFVLAIELFGE